MRASSSNDKIPSYAPRGANRSHIYSLKNNQLDYSNYTLKGDVTDDYAVDFNDINAIKEALFNDNNSAQFDINNDSVLNLEDLIELVARVNTHISYFDFYTIKGEKLVLATRSVDDEKTLDEASLLEFNLTQVMVVAKDRNHASGFSEGLSDLEDVWYKQKDWIYANTTILEDNPTNATQRSKSKMLQNALDYIVNDVEVDDYLIGWSMSLKFAETGEFKDLFKKEGGTEAGGEDDEVGGQYDDMFENLDFYINPAVAKIRSYFTATNMNNPEKDASTAFGYFYTIGDTRDIDRYVEVVGKDLRQESAYVNGETTVYTNEIFMAGSVLFLSKATHELKGKIDKETQVEGKISIKRTGPGKKEFSQDTPVKDGKFSLKDVPFGAYSIEMEDACKCLSSLDNNFIFNSDEAEASFTMNNNTKAKVSLRVIDKEGNPFDEPQSVKLEADECLNQGAGSNTLLISHEGVTDKQGNITFSDVLIGDYTVYVNNEPIKPIHFCADTSMNVVVATVTEWRFNVQYFNPDYGNAQMSVENIKIDFDAKPEHGVTFFAMKDSASTCSGIFNECGGFMLTDSYIYPNKKVIFFSAIARHLVGFPNQEIASLDFIVGNNGFACDGTIPGTFDKSSSSLHWTFDTSYQKCIFTLEKM